MNSTILHANDFHFKSMYGKHGQDGVFYFIFLFPVRYKVHSYRAVYKINNRGPSHLVGLFASNKFIIINKVVWTLRVGNKIHRLSIIRQKHAWSLQVGGGEKRQFGFSYMLDKKYVWEMVRYITIFVFRKSIGSD